MKPCDQKATNVYLSQLEPWASKRRVVMRGIGQYCEENK